MVRRRADAVILMAGLLSACTNDPYAACAATEPSGYTCTTPDDAGVSAFVSVRVLTTDLERGYFPREPKCLFSADGGVGAIGFDQPFCRSTPLDRFGEDVRNVNVRCELPEGRWTLTGTDGFSLQVERTTAGHVCTR